MDILPKTWWKKITQPVNFVNTDGFLNKDNQKKWTFLQPKVKEFVNISMEPSMQILRILLIVRGRPIRRVSGVNSETFVISKSLFWQVWIRIDSYFTTVIWSFLCDIADDLDLLHPTYLNFWGCLFVRTSEGGINLTFKEIFQIVSGARYSA